MKDFKLKNKKINAGFKVPDAYFEQVENNILAQVLVKKEPKVISLWKNKKVWMTSIAAVFLVSIALPTYYALSKNNTLDEESMTAYLSMQPSINTYEIASQLTNEDITTLEGNLALNDDAIALYLEENHQNIDLYLNE